MVMGTVVVKIGGSTLGSHDTTLQDIVTLQQRGVRVIVTHGGGPIISDWMDKQGLVASFNRGLRVTDAPTMEIVTAVLAGLVNTELVSSLLKLGGMAIGMSGVDGAMIQATVLDPTLGLVGRIERVDVRPLQVILEAGYCPVISPLGISSDEGQDVSGVVLNINGDTAAGEIAAAINAEHLIFLTDVAGVLDSSNQLLSTITPPQVAELINSGVVQGGMLPKLEAAFTAAGVGTVTRIIDGRHPGALLDALGDGEKGTLVV